VSDSNPIVFLRRASKESSIEHNGSFGAYETPAVRRAVATTSKEATGDVQKDFHSSVRFSFAISAYVISFQIAHPESVYWQLALWLPWIRLDCFGEAGFIASFVFALACVKLR
jgi:hypothetical protein